MTISHSVSSSIRRPGRFFDFNVANANRGLAVLNNRLALVGGLVSAGSKSAGTLVQIFSESDADTYFGMGSELALMCKWALRGAKDYGKAPEVWAIGIADAGTAAEQTLTITGTPTAAGDIVIKIAGREIRSAVAVSDSVTVMATALDSAIDAIKADLPVTSSSSIGVVTCVSVSKGVNGEDIPYEIVSAPAGVTVTPASSVTGATAKDITTSLDALEDKDYDFVVCANHAAADVADFAAHLVNTWDAGAKRWRFTCMAETGSLATGQGLATAADDYKQLVITAEDFPNTPGEIVAYVCAAMAGETDPALSFNNVPMKGLYLPPKASIPTNAEIESAIAGGMTILSTNEKQTEAKIVRAVTTKVTHNSVPFYDMLDVTTPRSLVYGARQIDIAQALRFDRAKQNDRTRKAIVSVAIDVAHKLEELEIWQNVSALESEFVAETDSLDPTRVALAVPASVVPILNQIINVLNLRLE